MPAMEAAERTVQSMKDSCRAVVIGEAAAVGTFVGSAGLAPVVDFMRSIRI